ncbi:MAG: 16S rRNA (uracil(1498)-N(3))-methyltransferase [Acidobacteria bacterium]|nr:16S rRNA (uracil(1498)-N(3))-methyltransferase [Acidobacteriota bacterium]
MKDRRRFFAPTATSTGEVVPLPPDESAHLIRVLRLRVGDEVRVFDGRGHEWAARVASVAKRQVSVALRAPVTPQTEPRVAITLAPAVLKGESLDEVVRDATVLGAAIVTPVITARSARVRGFQVGASRMDRWRRIAATAAKQCGRAVVPAIEAPAVFQAFIDRTSHERNPGRHLVMAVEPDASASTSFEVMDVREYQRRHPTAPVAATLLIGPEGGWTADEVALAEQSGWTLVTLGRRTFRADAMPLIGLALFQFVWGDF